MDKDVYRSSQHGSAAERNGFRSSCFTKEGLEEIEILVHSATSVPKLRDRPPGVFASIKSEEEFERKIAAKSTTRVAEKSCNPQWGEIVRLSYDAGDDMVGVLTLVDSFSKSILAKFRIPARQLKFFTQYHLELVDQDVSCYVSVRRKMHCIDAKSLEVVLCDLTEPIDEIDLNGFVAIIRTVPDLLTYRMRYMNYLFDGDSRPTIEFQPIDLCLQAPNVQARSAIGFPQTVPISSKVTKGHEVTHSWWSNILLKSRYIKELFQPAAGLVIELYRNNLFSSNEVRELRAPFAYSELSMQFSEKTLLQSNPDGIFLSDVSFRRIDLDSPKLPKLRIALRMVQKNDYMSLTPKIIKKLRVIDEAELMEIRMGNESGKNGRSQSRKNSLVPVDEMYPAEKMSIEDMLSRSSRRDAASPVIEYKKPQSTHEQALLRMSADYLSVKSHKDKLEEDNFELRDELNKLKRQQQLKEALVSEGGLEFSQPDEIANRFIHLREKHRKVMVENDDMKSKLRLYESDLIQNDSKHNTAMKEIKKYVEQSERQMTTIDMLNKKRSKDRSVPEQLKDQKKLEELCKEQEKIIAKLEDLFSKTKISIDNSWKGEMDQMIAMARDRPRYNDQMFPPIHQNPYGYYPPQIMANGSNEIYDEFEAERYRNKVLERQLQDMARTHAKEKQGLVNKLEGLRYGVGDGYDRNRYRKPFSN